MIAHSLESPMGVASETINIRVQPTARDLIDQAARSVGKNRTEFIIAAARREAEAVLLDQRLFTLEGPEFDKFCRALDEPAEVDPMVQNLLNTPAPWDE